MFDSTATDSDDNEFHGPASRSQSDWEAAIRDAGGYVRPGDQLRPRILDAVSRRRRRRDAWQRCLGSFALTCTAIVALLIAGQFGRALTPQGRSANDLQQQATTRAMTEGVAWEWALTDAVYDWRRPETSGHVLWRVAPEAPRSRQDREAERRGGH